MINPQSVNPQAADAINRLAGQLPDSGQFVDDKEGRSEPSGNGHNGRDANGRFAAGNPGGPGNRYARQVAELRFYFMQGVTPEVMQQFAAKLIQMGLNGNPRAMKLVLSYVLSTPGAAVDPDLLDHHALAVECNPFRVVRG